MNRLSLNILMRFSVAISRSLEELEQLHWDFLRRQNILQAERNEQFELQQTRDQELVQLRERHECHQRDLETDQLE